MLDSRTTPPEEVGVRSDLSSDRPWAYIIGLSEDQRPDLAKCGPEAAEILSSEVFPALRIRDGGATTVGATLAPEGFSVGQNFLLSGDRPVLDSVVSVLEERAATARRNKLKERYGKAGAPLPASWVSSLVSDFPQLPPLPSTVTLWSGLYNVFGHLCLVFPPDLETFLNQTLAAFWETGLGEHRRSAAEIYVD